MTPENGAVERFLAITDLTSIVADALDVVGIGSGCVPGHVLTPLSRGRRICGPAVTLRYVAEQKTVPALRAAGERPRLGHQAVLEASRPGGADGRGAARQRAARRSRSRRPRGCRGWWSPLTFDDIHLTVPRIRARPRHTPKHQPNKEVLL